MRKVPLLLPPDLALILDALMPSGRTAGEMALELLREWSERQLSMPRIPPIRLMNAVIEERNVARVESGKLKKGG
jgi:hypothetical protein